MSPFSFCLPHLYLWGSPLSCLPQLYLWGSPFSFCLPHLYPWVSPCWVRFLRMWLIFNPTIEVVTFHLRGWCMLGVFLLPAFTCLGHEHQDLLSLCDGMHVCTTRPQLTNTLIQKTFQGMESEPMLTPRQRSILPKYSPQRRMEPTMLHQAGQRAQHTTNELLWPQRCDLF